MEFKIYKRKDSGLITAFLFNTIKDHKVNLPKKPEPTHVKPEGLSIFFTYKKQRYDATWIDSNKITYQGKDYTSPSALSVELTETARNGWRARRWGIVSSGCVPVVKDARPYRVVYMLYKRESFFEPRWGHSTLSMRARSVK